MTKLQSYALRDMFRNDDFAWEILEEEIKLETSGTKIDGQDIARLLALYMKGVETLNSMRDGREFFFRNRLNNLMMRPNVVQVLSQGSKVEEKGEEQVRGIGTESPQHKLKKAELEIRVTYAQQENKLEDMKKVIVQHQSKVNLLTSTLQQVVNESKNRLQDRIKSRRLRATSARQRSIQTYQQKQFKPEVNTFQTLGEIKQQTQDNNPEPKKKHRSQSLDLKKDHRQSFVEIGFRAKGFSMFVPSTSRKQSQELNS